MPLRRHISLRPPAGVLIAPPMACFTLLACLIASRLAADLNSSPRGCSLQPLAMVSLLQSLMQSLSKLDVIVSTMSLAVQR